MKIEGEVLEAKWREEGNHFSPFIMMMMIRSSGCEDGERDEEDQQKMKHQIKYSYYYQITASNRFPTHTFLQLLYSRQFKRREAENGSSERESPAPFFSHRCHFSPLFHRFLDRWSGRMEERTFLPFALSSWTGCGFRGTHRGSITWALYKLEKKKRTKRRKGMVAVGSRYLSNICGCQSITTNELALW